ncbi:hypothetical protein GF391_01240 [Candidatus Uhrbacteria bacterium]|nr:hypothetical protein [Candidatus Uhrbacteria bacterium]
MVKKKEKKEASKRESGKVERKQVASENSVLKRVVAVFATFFIVVGVAVVGLLAKDTMPEMTEEFGDAATTTEVIEPVVMAVDHTGAKLYKMDGDVAKDLAWPDDLNLLGKPLSQFKGADMMSGQAAWLKNGFRIATSTKFRSPDGRREMRLEEVRRDGSKPLIISYGSEEDTRILRLNGKVIQDLEIIGWLDNEEVVFMGDATGTKAVFTMSLGGVLDYIAPVESEAWKYRIYDNTVYWVTSDIGEDDGEEYKAAPGSIQSLRLEGELTEQVRELDFVIQDYVLGESGIYYVLADQSMVLRDDKRRVPMGKCMALLAIKDGVICRAGDGIEYRREGQDPVRLFDAEEGAVFYLPEVKLEK